jgi:hypothetical protein
LVHTEQGGSDDGNGGKKFGIHTKDISRLNQSTAVGTSTFNVREWERDPLYDALLTLLSIFA